MLTLAEALRAGLLLGSFLLRLVCWLGWRSPVPLFSERGRTQQYVSLKCLVDLPAGRVHVENSVWIFSMWRLAPPTLTGPLQGPVGWWAWVLAPVPVTLLPGVDSSAICSLVIHI